MHQRKGFPFTENLYTSFTCPLAAACLLLSCFCPFDQSFTVCVQSGRDCLKDFRLASLLHYCRLSSTRKRKTRGRLVHRFVKSTPMSEISKAFQEYRHDNHTYSVYCPAQLLPDDPFQSVGEGHALVMTMPENEKDRPVRTIFLFIAP